MTVNYGAQAATIRYGSMSRLLLRWRGSVYKAVWPIVTMYCVVYGAMALIYWQLPSSVPKYRAAKKLFVQICSYAENVSNFLPLNLVLGFYVNLVVSRWWQQFQNLPTSDSVCMLLGAYVREPIDETRTTPGRPLLFRRTVARYLNLSAMLCFSCISFSMKCRVPDLDVLVTDGFLTKQEMEIYHSLDQGNGYFFIPITWAITLLTRAHHEGMIHHERHMDSLVAEVVAYWNKLYTMFLYDYVNVPLVYNQVSIFTDFFEIISRKGGFNDVNTVLINRPYFLILAEQTKIFQQSEYSIVS